MKYLIMHASVVPHDAVGNDIEIMYEIIRKMGDECKVYTELQASKNVEYASLEEAGRLLTNPEATVIYHHSVYWKQGYELLKDANCRVVVRYHNVTPPTFFHHLFPEAERQCSMGRKQTIKLQKTLRNAYFLADSEYNASELHMVRKDHVVVIPPFHRTEEWGRSEIQTELSEQIKKDGSFNLLFVGRTAPNKGHLAMLDVIKTYRHFYDDDIHLRIIGKMGATPRYDRMVLRKIHEYELTDQVEFIGEINDNILATYYKESDVMLCLSEHEGFCVPLIEAQYFGLPVVALSGTAVPETLGEGQLVLERDYVKFAAALRIIHDSREVKENLARTGKRNFDTRFSRTVMEQNFIEFLRMIKKKGEII